MKRIIFICLIVVLVSGCLADPISEEEREYLLKCERVAILSNVNHSYACKFYDDDNVCYVVTISGYRGTSIDCLKVEK